MWTKQMQSAAMRRALVWGGVALPVVVLLSCRAGPDTVAQTPNAAPAAVSASPTPAEAARVRLGEMMFADKSLSEPRGTACISCHGASTGLAGNNGSKLGVAVGSKASSLGLRNTMSNGYASYVPAFEFVTDEEETEARGGHFWDGRANGMEQQALGPFLNPLEMNNPDRAAVVAKIAAAPYAPLFRQEFGAKVFDNTDQAFEAIGVAISAFERAKLQSFSSKYDAMVLGKAEFTHAEARGMALFMDPKRANCAGCHLMDPKSGKPENSLFTEFTYYATGIPRNTDIPRNADPAFFDLGLCGPERDIPALPASVPADVKPSHFCGMFRMPSLRNVAKREAYMHNGYFKGLREVVRFYSTRNSDPKHWYGAAGVPNDLPAQYRANIEHEKAPFNSKPSDGPLLSEGEINDIVAFLHTLNDGYYKP